jgi:hypothetical protein
MPPEEIAPGGMFIQTHRQTILMICPRVWMNSRTRCLGELWHPEPRRSPSVIKERPLLQPDTTRRRCDCQNYARSETSNMNRRSVRRGRLKACCQTLSASRSK